jgi:hypothetical protein
MAVSAASISRQLQPVTGEPEPTVHALEYDGTRECPTCTSKHLPALVAHHIRVVRADYITMKCNRGHVRVLTKGWI